ncbi:MAG: hypothetical protein AAGF25_04410 [Pseudomonadota bacterium]
MNTHQLADLHYALSIAVQALVQVLDTIDGDPELETADLPDDECTGDLEYSLGWSARFYQGSLSAAYDDLEEQVELEDCLSQLGDHCWPETHGLGALQEISK